MNITVTNVKIMVTAPSENAEEIRLVLGKAGAGIIGNYSYCSETINCLGTFKGNDSTEPYLGVKNNLEYAEEVRIEVICPIHEAKAVIQKLREVHPYEEPAIFIIPLIDEKMP